MNHNNKEWFVAMESRFKYKQPKSYHIYPYEKIIRVGVLYVHYFT